MKNWLTQLFQYSSSGLAPSLSRSLKMNLRWTLRASVVGVLAGTASAIFLVSLDWVTQFRENHRWLIYGLPLAGMGLVWIYRTHGKGTDLGNHLLLEEIHEPQALLPPRMGPFIFLSTLVTHLFGGSAGREGTAVQMAASISDTLSRLFEVSAEDRRLLLLIAIAAGFGSVFGTPMAGAVFAIEVLAFGRLRYDALYPCVVGAVIAHWTTLSWGVNHFFFPQLDAVISGQLRSLNGAPTLSSMAQALIVGIVFGLVARAFVAAVHGVEHWSRRLIENPYFRIAAGALVIVVVFILTDSTRYLGLGMPVISESFRVVLPPWDFAAKLILTAITLGVGFKGGEVTPLFFIGATLGSALSHVFPMPTPVLSGLGLVGVFSAAANTPLAGVLIAVELFGAKIAILAALSGVAAYLASGHTGIYTAQRVGYPKLRELSAHEGMAVGSLPRGLR